MRSTWTLYPAEGCSADETPEPLLVRNIVRATGEERWLIVRSSPIADPVTGRIELAVNVLENITGVKRAQLAESFMAQASRVLASSMDYGETLQRVARLAVPQIADWCAIDLRQRTGRDRAGGRSSHRPGEDRAGQAPQPPATGRRQIGRRASSEVIRTGTARIYTEFRPEASAADAHDDEHLESLRTLGASAVVIVPLRSAVGTIGAITLVTSESLRRALRDRHRARRAARPAGRNGGRTRTPLHRACAHRPCAPAGPAPRVAGRDPWSRGAGSLLVRRAS